MNDAVLIQHAYPGQGMEEMMELTRAHHENYCRTYSLDYLCEIYEKPSLPMSQGAWLKIELIQEALKHYDSVIWLDADTLICDMDTDLRDGVQLERIGACWHRIPQLNHWNVGALYLDNCEAVRNFVDEWLASYPPPADGWFEQGVFNRMGRASRVVTTLSDRWNATLDVSMVPDAVVLGFHGQGNPQQRTKIMRQTYERLFAVERV